MMKHASPKAFMEEERNVRAEGIATPDWFIDSFYGNATIETLVSILEQMPQGLSELVTHPGYICNNSHNLDYSLQREMELEVLKSDTLRQILEEMQITLIAYSQLKALKTEN
jgi:predicted glycoside hydrolase/deacetylase ChbG (UPF0249 family)